MQYVNQNHKKSKKKGKKKGSGYKEKEVQEKGIKIDCGHSVAASLNHHTVYCRLLQWAKFWGKSTHIVTMKVWVCFFIHDGGMFTWAGMLVSTKRKLPGDSQRKLKTLLVTISGTVLSVYILFTTFVRTTETVVPMEYHLDQLARRSHASELKSSFTELCFAL